MDAKPIVSLRDLAEAYATVLEKYDRAEPFGQTEADQLRAVVRGSQSPVDVPLEEFELICTEGDRNNMGSIRVRYNAMLAQAAYDGAPPRAMAVEDLPHPVPTHAFLRGNPNNPGALAPPHFLTCLGGSEEKAFRDGSGRLELARRLVSDARDSAALPLARTAPRHRCSPSRAIWFRAPCGFSDYRPGRGDL